MYGDVSRAERLKKRARIVAAVRAFFADRGYLEVETPLRAKAILPEAHIDPVRSGDSFLLASPEQFMKRLLCSGCDRIFQLCKAFRAGERGSRHLPEFTILEWYRTGADYRDLMVETEELVRHVAAALESGNAVFRNGRRIDLSGGWEMISVAEAFKRYAGTRLDHAVSCGRYDEIMGIEIEPKLGHGRPVFLYDYPFETGASFARAKASDPSVVERFELYIGGLELCNGFSELIGAENYRERLEKENQRRAEAGKEPLGLPERFLDEIGRMPDAGGNALGVDRLVMLFCGTDDISDVVAFPPELT